MKRKGARVLAGLLAAALLTAAAALMVKKIGERMQAQELAVLSEQVKRAAVSCYASEGRYPQELAYLVEYYGLVYDQERYSILYDAFASNILPDIDVTIRGE